MKEITQTGSNVGGLTFYSRRVKGQLPSDILMFCSSAFLAIIQPVIQELKGKLWPYFIFGQKMNVWH